MRFSGAMSSEKGIDSVLLMLIDAPPPTMCLLNTSQQTVELMTQKSNIKS
jgi:hypothetical protein